MRPPSVLVDVKLCASADCINECFEVCRSVRGADAPLSIVEDTKRPVIDTARCTGCLLCVRACPAGALRVSNVEDTRRGTRTEQGRTASEDTPGTDYRPYEVASDYAPFDESRTIFARVYNDETFPFFGMNEFAGAEQALARHMTGYDRFTHELAMAAWKIHNLLRDPHSDIDRARREMSAPRRRARATPDELTRMVKRAALFLGGALVGVARVDRRWLYTGDRRGRSYGVPKSINRVVVVAVEMDYDAISTSPSFAASAETGRCYSVMTFIEVELAAFIRRLGYVAIPCGNEIALSVPVAIDAGLGQYGRHGLLITKEFGSRVHIANVLTDAPLVPDSPDRRFCESVTRFCEVCEKCARLCPSQSIAYGRERSWTGKTVSNNSGVKKWYINPETCYGFWIRNGSDCANCIRSCPYNKPNNVLHRVVLWVTQHLPWLDRVIVKMDDIVGFGRQRPSSALWKRLRPR